MKKTARRIIGLILVICMFFTVNSSIIYAKEISDNFDNYIMSLEGPSGYQSIGTCTIPESVSKVRIKTTGLQAYFYNEDFWISMGENNGTTNI